MLQGYQVAPAELESVLLEHPDIVDAGVVGIVSEAEATELPRFAFDATLAAWGLTRSYAGHTSCMQRDSLPPSMHHLV